MAERSVREVVGVARELLGVESPGSNGGNSRNSDFGVDMSEQLGYVDAGLERMDFSDRGGGGGSGSESFHGSEAGFRDDEFGSYSEISAQAF